MLVIIGSVIVMSHESKNPSIENDITRQSLTKQADINQSQKLLLGDPDAPVSIVEYFDYKCPNCNNFHRTVATEINDAYVESGKVNYEIRITPIIGPDSATAARGAYCANDQNTFEIYHNTVLDYMYDTYYGDGTFSAELENILTVDRLSELMNSTDIDQNAFKACVESDRYNASLDANLEAAADDSIQGTPGFAIGEQTFVGGQPFTVFKTLLDIELR